MNDEIALDQQWHREFDPESPLIASGNLRRRRAVNRAAEAAATAAAVLALIVLGLVIATVVGRGGGAISWDFLTRPAALPGQSGGGIAEAIVGTGLIVAVAAAMAMPVGVLVALYLTEFAGARTARPVKLALDLLNGLPTIVVGLFVFGFMVAGHHQSGFAGSIGLAIVMVPLIARASQEMLSLVPRPLRDAADALGVGRWRTVIGVILPSALSGIVTGAVLAVARAAGETAPLLLLTSIYNPSKMTYGMFGAAMPNIPLEIFRLGEEGDPQSIQQAWGAALVLLGSILIANIGARALLARSRGKFQS